MNDGTTASGRAGLVGAIIPVMQYGRVHLESFDTQGHLQTVAP
ncbi:hypothetical protein [Ferrovum sp.]|nr:hypothetical protein [Ferrovum sp.]